MSSGKNGENVDNYLMVINKEWGPGNRERGIGNGERGMGNGWGRSVLLAGDRTGRRRQSGSAAKSAAFATEGAVEIFGGV